MKNDYPEDEQYITEPTLVIGTTNAACIRHSAFVYEIDGVSYSKDAGEVTLLELATVPQNKYGAFSLAIDSDGDITVSEADGNEDGYDSAGEAVYGITTGNTTAVVANIPAPDGDGTVQATIAADFVAGATQPTARTTSVVGTVLRPSTHNGYLYECTISAGVYGTEPTWGTIVGGTTSDGTNTWICRTESLSSVGTTNGLPSSDSDSCFMGFVTAICTAATGFIPGTTELSHATVTDTYTDGNPAHRGDPKACLIYDEYLYVRPKADRIMQIKAPKIIRPDALDTTEAPLDIAWGPLIALGAAIEYVSMIKKDKTQAQKLREDFEEMKDEILSKVRSQNQPQYANPCW